MNRIILTIATAAIMGVSASAADYQPFVQDGKVWHMVCEYDIEIPNAPVSYSYDYFIYGDTVIGGTDYKKLYVYNSDNTHHVYYNMALREDEKKVFFVLSNSDEEYLMYDFGVGDGDYVTVSTSVLSRPYWTTTLAAVEHKSMSFNGAGRRLMRMVDRKFYDEMPLEDALTYSGWWIEGVGSNDNPMSPGMFGASGSHYFLTGCEVNGNVIIDQQGLGFIISWTPAWAADLNHDGSVDIDDVNAVVNALLRQ